MPVLREIERDRQRKGRVKRENKRKQSRGLQMCLIFSILSFVIYDWHRRKWDVKGHFHPYFKTNETEWITQVDANCAIMDICSVVIGHKHF